MLYVGTDGAASANGRLTCKAAYGYIIINHTDMDVVKLAFEEKNPDKELDCFEGSGNIPEVIYNGKKMHPSNNRAELTGVIKALEFIQEENLTGDITIFSDSKYTIGSITYWADNWFKNPAKYKLSAKQNLDLIIHARDLITKMPDREIKFKHVRGHKEPPEKFDDWLPWLLNYKADKLCSKQNKKCNKR